MLAGIVFVSEGIQKFLFPYELGTGRFIKIGLPFPEFLGPFVGTFEIMCGLLLIAGLFTRLASIPLLIIMITAILSTKFQVFRIEGFWPMMHGSRTDLSMLFCCIFLVIKGGGRWSMDKLIQRKRSTG